jgi:hypothetical protein
MSYVSTAGIWCTKTRRKARCIVLSVLLSKNLNNSRCRCPRHFQATCGSTFLTHAEFNLHRNPSQKASLPQRRGDSATYSRRKLSLQAYWKPCHWDLSRNPWNVRSSRPTCARHSSSFPTATSVKIEDAIAASCLALKPLAALRTRRRAGQPPISTRLS